MEENQNIEDSNLKSAEGEKEWEEVLGKPQVHFGLGTDERPLPCVVYSDGSWDEVDLMASLESDPASFDTPFIKAAIRRYISAIKADVKCSSPYDPDAQTAEAYLKAIFEAIIRGAYKSRDEILQADIAVSLLPQVDDLFKYISKMPEIKQLKEARNDTTKGEIIKKIGKELTEKFPHEDVASIVEFLEGVCIKKTRRVKSLPQRISYRQLRNVFQAWKEDTEINEVKKSFSRARTHFKEKGIELSTFHYIVEKSTDALPSVVPMLINEMYGIGIIKSKEDLRNTTLVFKSSPPTS